MYEGLHGEIGGTWDASLAGVGLISPRFLVPFHRLEKEQELSVDSLTLNNHGRILYIIQCFTFSHTLMPLTTGFQRNMQMWRCPRMIQCLESHQSKIILQ